MFSFVIKYFGFLKAVPGLPHLFDSMLCLWKLVTKPSVLDYMDEIETEILRWEGTDVSLHKYGGTQFNFNGHEIGHIHGNGLLDILFNRKIKEELLKGGKVHHHHVFKKSGWISFYLKSAEDKEYAKNLLELSYSQISRRTKNTT